MEGTSRKESKKSLLQKNLRIILHAQHCEQQEDECGIKDCEETKKILCHAETCKETKSCIVKHCGSFKLSLDHWRKCSNTSCVICQPFMTDRSKQDGSQVPFADEKTFMDISHRVENLERRLQRTETDYKKYTEEVDNKLMALQDSNKLHSQSIAKLENLLLDIQKGLSVLERKCGNNLPVNQSIYQDDDTTSNEIVNDLNTLEKIGKVTGNDKNSGNSEELMETDNIRSCSRKRAVNVVDDVHETKPVSQSIRRNDTKEKRHHKSNQKYLKDEFGFKRLKTETESDNRVLMYQDSAKAPWTTRKSSVVQNTNIKWTRTESEQTRSKPREQDMFDQSELFKFQYDDFDVDDMQVESSTWIALANEEVVKGRFTCRRGKGPDTCLVLDISDSMSGEPFVQMIEAAKTIINGIADMAATSPIQENVAIATFGHENRVLQHMTNEYSSVISKLDYISTGGHTPMTAGLLMGLAGCLGNCKGNATVISGQELHSRIILMSDGKATVDSTMPTQDRTSSSINPSLIRPFLTSTCQDLMNRKIKVFWVPIGNSPESVFPSMITSQTGGQPIPVSELDRIIQTTKMKLLASDIVSKHPELETVIDIDTLKSIAESIKIHVPCYEDLKWMIDEIYGISDSAFQFLGGRYEEGDPSMPSVGTRVRRGPTWTYHNQDGGGPGTIIGSQFSGSVWVEWDNGHKNTYMLGAGRKDLRIVDEPRKLLPGEIIATGCFVRRSCDWKKGDLDGGIGSKGVVFAVQENGRVGVRWPNRKMCFHNFGHNGKFDVEFITADNSRNAVQSNNKQISSEPKYEVNHNEDTTQPKKIGDLDEKLLNTLNKRNEEKLRERQEELSGSWEYEKQGNTWTEYPEDIRVNLEKAYKRSKNGMPIIELNGELYRVMFSRMLKINQKTNAVTRIRRLDHNET